MELLNSTTYSDRRSTEEDLRHSNTRLDLLASTTNELLRADDPHKILTSICHKVLAALDCQLFLHYLIDSKAGRLHLDAFAGIPPDKAALIEWLDFHSTVCGSVARDDEPVIVGEVQNSFDPQIAVAKSFGTRAFACYPLKAKGAVIGTVAFGTDTRDHFSDEDLSVLKTVTDQIAIALYRKRMESALHEQKNRLQMLIDHAPAALALFDNEMRYLSVSRRWMSNFGLEGQNLIGRSHYDVFPEIPEHWRVAHRRSLAGEVRTSAGEPFYRADGSVQWVRWEMRPWHDELGEIGGVVIFSEDITERKKSEEALRESEARFRQAVESLPQLVWTCTPDGGCDYLSPQWGGYTGVLEQNHLGFAWLELVHPDDRERVLGHWQETVLQGGNLVLDLRLRRQDGAYRWFKAVGVPLFDGDGRIVKWFGTNTDIDDKKQTEESLRQSERRFRTLVENLQVGIFIHQNNEITYANPAIANLFGAQRLDQVIGRSPYEFLHPDDHAEVAHKSVRSLWEGNRIPLSEAKIRRADGGERVAEMGVVAFTEYSDPALLFMMHDITDRKRFENEQQLAHDQLEQRVKERTLELQASNRELQSFCYSVAHELGAPLRGMNCFSNILLQEHAAPLEAEGRDLLARIGEAAGRMGRLVEDLLKLSRVTRRKLCRERVDLSHLAWKIFENLHAIEPTRQVQVEVAEGIEGEWDRGLVTLALENLFNNAWKYTGRIERPRIRFGSFVKEGKTILFVSDNGIGFEKEYAEKIFRPFERLHRIGEYEGTGIGLATVQRVIAMHGGRVWAEADPGKGATFLFTEGEG